jgi:predicted RNase H-like HicB family nuclease
LAVLSSLFILYNTKIIIVKNIQYSSVVWQEEQYFVAQCLNLDVSSFGDRREEAMLNLQEVLSLYFETS